VVPTHESIDWSFKAPCAGGLEALPGMRGLVLVRPHFLRYRDSILKSVCEWHNYDSIGVDRLWLFNSIAGVVPGNFEIVLEWLEAAWHAWFSASTASNIGISIVVTKVSVSIKHNC
jgi:hypothetical protein